MTLYPLSKLPLMKSVMTPFPYTIEPDSSLREAKQMMAEHGIHHLPVAKDGKLLGMLSDRDLRWALDPVFDLGEEEKVKVEVVYRRNLFTCDINARLDDVLLEMAEEHYGSAMVTKHGKLVGIFTVTDACRIFGEYLSKRFAGATADEVA
jgi:acetoin utilization protein AcuB